jgi:hypothetical protein
MAPHLTPSECREFAAECLQLRELPDVSPQRARILLTMARNWTAMAGLKERLRQLRKEAESQHNAPT